MVHFLSLRGSPRSTAYLCLDLIRLGSAYFQEQVFREVVVATQPSSFIRCRFEDCQGTENGALVSSGNNELVVEQTDPLRCWSKTKCAGLKKENGKLQMNCCLFKECHGNRDDNIFGTAMGTSNCDAKILDATFLMCWKAASPYADAVYGLYKGAADINGINSSNCISRNGGLSGNLFEVGAGADLRYIQGVQGEEHNGFEIFHAGQTVHCMNLINNSFSHFLFYSKYAKLLVSYG